MYIIHIYVYIYTYIYVNIYSINQDPALAGLQAPIAKRKLQVVSASAKTCNLEANNFKPLKRLKKKTQVLGPDTSSRGLQGFTVITSIWSDGTQGPLTIVVDDKSMSQKLLEELNDEFEGEVFLMQSGVFRLV